MSEQTKARIFFSSNAITDSNDEFAGNSITSKIARNQVTEVTE